MPTSAIDVVAQRLRNQKLARSTFRQPEEVVAWLGAMQAQDYTGAKWGIGLRSRGVADADVDRACDEGRILRTHVMRPTWHFVAPQDIRWLLALTAPRVQAFNAYWNRVNELDDRIFARSRKAIERALEGGATLTRAELASVLAGAGIEASGTRLAALIMHAELNAVICSGPRRDRQFTYALLDERVPSSPRLTRDEALAELTQRYFASHGPATLRDFAWWSGLTARDVKAGVESVSSTLAHFVQQDLSHWFLPSRATARDQSPSAFLLPNYDEYLIAHKDRGHVVHPSTPPAPTRPVEYPHHLVIDGRLRGTWKRRIGTRTAEVTLRPYRPLTKKERRAVGSEADRYGTFLEMVVTLVESSCLS
jgi:hypothetical protein